MTGPNAYVLFGGDVALWEENGVIMLKTCDPSGDPVELNEDEAVTLSQLLLKLSGKSA
jgi:hypothetical protein